MSTPNPCPVPWSCPALIAHTLSTQLLLAHSNSVVKVGGVKREKSAPPAPRSKLLNAQRNDETTKMSSLLLLYATKGEKGEGYKGKEEE